jgi:hypothetical protein
LKLTMFDHLSGQNVVKDKSTESKKTYKAEKGLSN